MIKWELVRVTPELAAKWLGKNDVNRKLREHRCAFIARSIEDQKWVTTHQAIAFSKSGRLLDGQHRLRAVIMANKAIEIWVATNVPDEAFQVMDSGLPRKMYERLNSDPRRTAIATTLFRVVGPRPIPHEYEIQLLLDMLEPAFVRLEAIPKAMKPSKVTKASVLAAAVLRIAGTKPGSVAHTTILDSVGRLVAGDLSGSSRVIVSLYRQLVEGVNTQGSSNSTNDVFCRAFYALDPKNSAINKIILKDLSGPLSEARKVFADLSEDVFEEAA